MPGQHDFSQAINPVQRQLAKWRECNHAPKPIPEAIWQQAAALAEQFGLSKVCQALRLGRATLNKRLASSTTPVAARLPAAPPAFLEWMAPASSLVIEHCSFEVETPRGMKLKLELRGVSASGLATLVREFTG